MITLAEQNKHVATVLESVGIPTSNVLSHPGLEVTPGGVILEPRVFLPFEEMTEAQRETLAAIGVHVPRKRRRP